MRLWINKFDFNKTAVKDNKENFISNRQTNFQMFKNIAQFYLLNPFITNKENFKRNLKKLFQRYTNKR